MRFPYSVLLALTLMWLSLANVRAEIAVDKTMDVKPAILHIEQTIKNYAKVRAQGLFKHNIWVQNDRMRGGNSVFGWIVSGKKYLSTIAWYTPTVEPLPDCDNKSEDCDWIASRHTVCHLFLFEADTLNQASVTPLNIVRDRRQLKGKPRCQDVKAMATAESAPDTLLITLGYSDSAEPAEARYEPPEFITTVALHFDPTPGVLRVEQRDDCLGNPNNYKTIAAARKRLRECEATIPRSQEAGAR